MKRKAVAKWNGTLKEGNGTMSVESGLFEGAYSFGSRFENGKGTNPEELIGAAHAGCFSMALSLMLEEEGFPPESISTSAEVTLEKQGDDFSITTIRLSTEAKVPGMAQAAFSETAEKAKDGCPVSRALKGVRVDLDARLVS